MQFLNNYFIILSSTITLILFLSTTTSATRYNTNINSTTKYNELRDINPIFSKTITVDKSGQGNFTTVQKAIDSVPNNNRLWVRIHVKAGIYTEKVLIIKGKEYIFLEGESSRKTVIQWGDSGSIKESPTLKMFADNFVASRISFKNYYNHVKDEETKKITWAPAAIIAADKVSFYGCSFISVQDTLFDAQGRHYFENCYIEGAMDFIFGNGQSFYEKSKLNVSTRLLGSGGHTGCITAQGRESPKESTGFVFHFSTVIGTGPALLGRAYRNHSRVLFYKTYMDKIISPEGWSAWNCGGHEDLITYAEESCYGPGADKSKRVKWEKNLSVGERNRLIDVNNFINQDGWLQKQPVKPTTNSVII